MFNRLYVKIGLYFFSIILITLAAVSLLFFFSVGKPLAENIHTMLRSHTHYLASLVREAETRDRLQPAISQSFDRFSKYYGYEVALFDAGFRPIATSPSLKHRPVEVTEAMREQMHQQEMFIQSSHFGRPLIYILPVNLNSGGIHYLYITRFFPDSPNPGVFLGGLALIGFLLTVAAYPLSKHITRPLTRLTRNFESIAAGRFDAVPESRRKDEIGKLIRGYRRMSRSVHHMIHSKQQLLADISHELCSPMGRIRVGTELIKPALADEKSRQYLKNIENDIASMDHLIENLSVFSRMQLPGFTLNRKPVIPRELVEAIGGLYNGVASVRQIGIRTRVAEKLPEIPGDFEYLKQVFCNLMDNALRYAHAGQTICLGAEHRGEGVCFFVEDPGPGVPETDVEKIFEPFYRIDFSRSRDSGGAGLGLPLSRKIMELHGGNLEYTRTGDRTRMVFYVDRLRRDKD